MSGRSPLMAPRVIVFTDLDGTLLDAATYSAAPARAALEALTAYGAAIVFCSSKTAAEQRAIRDELGLTAMPFIVENGAAIIVPAGVGLPVQSWRASETVPGERLLALGLAARVVREAIRRASLHAGAEVVGYADLSLEEIVAVTGLSSAAAQRAAQREFSETLVGDFSHPRWPAFLAALSAEGMGAHPGGRFYTVTGGAADKGRAVRILHALYAKAGGPPLLTVGLGDSANDEPLLAAVDRSYQLPRPDGSFADLPVGSVRRVHQPGPAGWEDAIVDLLSSL